jgi:hypothetical protein
MAKKDKYENQRAAQEAGQKMGAATRPFEKGYKKGGSVKKAKINKKK